MTTPPDLGPDPAFDLEQLTILNSRFIQAVRSGDRPGLEAIITDDFTFMAGASGEIWDRETFFDNTIRPGFYKSLEFDQLYIRINGDTASVSARTHSVRLIEDEEVAAASRFVDIYARLNGEWRCVMACLWRL